MNKFFATTLLAFAACSSASAVEHSLTITFLTGTYTTTGGTITVDTDVAQIVTEASVPYVASVTEAVKAYARYQNGLKLGTTSAAGSLTLALTAEARVTPTRIDVTASSITDDETALTLVTGTTDWTTADALTTTPSTLTFTAANPGQITSLTLGTLQKRAYVQSVTIYYNVDNTQTDELTAASFSTLTNKYAYYTTSTDFADYTVFTYKNGGIQFNTGNSSNTNKAAFFVNASSGYKIAGISVESNYGSAGDMALNVYTSKSVYSQSTDFATASGTLAGTLTAAAPSLTLTGDVSHLAFTPATARALVATKITVTFAAGTETPSQGKVETPTFSLDPNSSVWIGQSGSQTNLNSKVTISCATPGANLHIEVLGAATDVIDAPAPYTYKFTKPGVTYIAVYGYKTGYDNSQIASAKYTVIGSSAVTDIETEDEDSPARYFNMQGVEIKYPQPGNVYLVRKGAQVCKMLVK